jgi:hypothetical protein
MTISIDVVLAGKEELAARLGGGDGGSRHQLGDLADGVDADGVVVERLVGHAVSVCVCCMHQA